MIALHPAPLGSEQESEQQVHRPDDRLNIDCRVGIPCFTANTQ
jgi:hypothetical protein